MSYGNTRDNLCVWYYQLHNNITCVDGAVQYHLISINKKFHVTRLHESKQYYHDISLAITVTVLNSVKCFTQLNVCEQ